MITQVGGRIFLGAAHLGGAGRVGVSAAASHLDGAAPTRPVAGQWPCILVPARGQVRTGAVSASPGGNAAVAGHRLDRATPAAVVARDASQTRHSVVVAAIDDDGNADEIIAYARTRSARLWVPLRVVHVWTERGIGPAGLRVLCRDRVDYADRLLSAVLHDHGPAAESTAVERQILHDDDPAHALVALSREAALLVVALNSDPTASDALPGNTTRRLIGHTGCPLAILPVTRRSATGPGW